MTLIARCHAALLRLFVSGIFLFPHTQFASALPTDLAFATARDGSRSVLPLHPIRPAQDTNFPDSQPTNTDGGKETHEGAGAKAAAPPMRARMARTRMVEVDGRKKGMTTRAKQAKQSEAKMAGEA